MTSQAQKNSGYPIPEEHVTEETQSFCIIIPAGDEFRQAAYAQLSMLGKWWRWKHNESPESTRARETAETWRLLFEMNENCEGDGDVATQEDIAKGMYQALNWLALQVATGSYQNVNLSTDEDGVVTQPDGSGAGEEIPPDDPGTPDFNESLASEYGGAVSVARGLEGFLDKVDTLYGATNGTPVTSEASAQTIIKSYYPNDGAVMDTAITNYYSWRATNSRILFNTSSSFEGYMYCNGYNEQAFNRWLIDQSGYAEQKRVIVSGLVTGLSDEFFSQLFAKGVKAPSTAYYAAPCTKVNDETFTLDMSTANTVQRTTIETWKANHRFLVRVTGTFHDTDSPDWYGDGMYFYNVVTGVKTFSNLGFNSSGGVANPTQAQVPYSPSHVYEFTIDRNNAADNICIIDKDNGSNMAVPNVSGILTITIKDLGDISV